MTPLQCAMKAVVKPHRRKLTLEEEAQVVELGWDKGTRSSPNTKEVVLVDGESVGVRLLECSITEAYNKFMEETGGSSSMPCDPRVPSWSHMWWMHEARNTCASCWCSCSALSSQAPVLSLLLGPPTGAVHTHSLHAHTVHVQSARKGNPSPALSVQTLLLR